MLIAVLTYLFIGIILTATSYNEMNEGAEEALIEEGWNISKRMYLRLMCTTLILMWPIILFLTFKVKLQKPTDKN